MELPLTKDELGKEHQMMKPKVAVLCVTHGRPEMVRRCLESCVRQDYERKEIVVVVNPADAASERAVREAAPEAKVICTHRNLGFFPALNLALANTEADYLMIVDDDAWFVADDAIGKLLGKFVAEPRLGAVTCNLEGPKETPITGEDSYIRVFTTGFTMMPRKVVTEWVGYIPDLFFRSAGETYWCNQLWEQGRPVKKVVDVRMFHALAMQGRSLNDWRFYGLRSQILCAVMRKPLVLLGFVLCSKFVRSFFHYGKLGQWSVWIQAWWSAFLHFAEAWQLRRPISVSTYFLLMRLNQKVVHDLDQLPQWQAGEKSRRGKST